MTRDEVRAAARRVTLWHERFTPLFGRREAQEHSLVYVRGLLSDQQRKSIEPIALHFARGADDAAATQNEVVALQGFITFAPWKVTPVFEEIQAVFAEELMPSAAQSSIGAVGVIDESGFVKAGKESVGVARQWCGRLGNPANCQVGVFLVGVTPGGTAFLDAQLFLTEERCADRAHRRKTRVPQKVKFGTKPEIAAEMIRRTLAAGKVHFDWITADELYGSNGGFLDALEAMGQRYVVEVRKNTIVWTVDPATLPGAHPGPKARKRIGCYRYPQVRSVEKVAASLAPEAWQPLVLREGAKGPLVHEFAAVRVWAMRHYKAGPPIWLVLRRTTEHTDLKYYVSNASVETPWQDIALAAAARWRVEECFEDGKMHLGMADYEARSWDSWHHHMALVALAHLYVTLTTRDVKHEVPELTLDLAIRILRSSFARPSLSEDEAVNIIDYHLERNRTAHDSHRKSWLAKHKRLAKKLLL
jgi:SRSO17 transposase